MNNPSKKTRLKKIMLAILTIPAFLIIMKVTSFFNQHTLFINGQIITMTGPQRSAEAVLVKNGKIVKIGSSDELLPYDDWMTNIIDLKGKTLMPGLIEAHCHPIITSILSQIFDLSRYDYSSRIDILEAIKTEVEKTHEDDWLIVFGWDPVRVDDLDKPTLAELDELSPDIPMLIVTKMGHTGFVNSAGYRAAGISKDSPDPVGSGAFLKDENGELNGVVYEVTALQYILKHLPKTPTSVIKLLLNIQYADYARAGYTSIGVLGPVEKAGYPLDFMEEVSTNSDVSVRTFIYGLENQVDQSGWQVNYGHDRFRLKGVKLYLDGSPFNGGAAFAEPYENTPLINDRLGLQIDHVGKANYSPHSFTELVQKYHDQDYQIAIHVQGETAVEIALDAIEFALQRNPRPDNRHRLEHNALITHEQIKRAKQLGVTLSFFVDHILYYGDKLEQIVGPDRTNRYMPLGTAINGGHFASIHTDNPVTPLGSFRSVKTAVLRQAEKTGETIGEHEKLSIYKALKTVTHYPAWQFFEEKNIGSIEEGKAADFVILGENPLDIDPDRLDKIEVVETWIGGRKVNTSYWTWTNFILALSAAGDMMWM